MHKLYRFPCALGIGLGFLLQVRTVQAQDAAFGDATGGIGSNASSTVASPAGTNIATGTISPTIPLLTLPSVSGGVAVSLRYTAGAGVKVNDIASEVGLGWMLVGGGSITREVKGRPDDSEMGWFKVVNYRSYFTATNSGGIPGFPTETAGNLVTYFKNKNNNQYTNSLGYTTTFGAIEPWCIDYLYSASQAVSFTNYDWGQYNAVYKGLAFIDTQPDVYTVALPSGSFQFVFDEVGNPVSLQGQNIKIEALNLGARGQNDYLQEFRVTTTDGIQYLFGSPQNDDSYTETLTVSTSSLGTEPMPSKEDYTCKYKWLLKKVISPIGEEITYTYNSGVSYALTTNNCIQQNFAYALEGGQPAYGNTSYTSPLSYTTWNHSYTIRTTASSTNYKQLATVSTTQGALEFIYQTTPRQDVGGQTKALAGLRLRNKQGTLIKQLDFVQHYAYAWAEPQASPSDAYHLLLDKILDKGAGCDYIEAYSFAYNSTTFCRNSTSKDDWGYFNNSSTLSTGELVGGYTSPAGAPRSFSFSGRDRSPSAGYSQAMLLQSIATAQGSVQSFEYALHEANAIYSPTGISGPIGGLRITQISQYDGISHNNDIVDTFLYQTTAGDGSGSYGDKGLYAKLQIMHGRSQYIYPSRIFTDTEIRSIVPVCSKFNSDKNNGANLDSYYLLRSDASFYQYAQDYIDYKSVIVDHGNKGKTQYEFTSWDDTQHRDYTDDDTRLQAGGKNPCADDPLNTSRKPFILPLPFSLNLYSLDLQYIGGGSTANFPCRTSRAVERGLLTRMTQLSATSTPVAVTTNEYDFAPSGVTLPIINALVAKPDMEVLGFSQNFNYFELYYYQYRVGWCPLVKTTQVLYDQQAAGDVTKSLKNVTDISYANFLPSKVSKYTVAGTVAPSTKYVTEFRRPQSFAGGDADQTTTPGLLRKAGMMATVVEQEDYVEQMTGASSTMIPKGASLAEYQLLNGQVLPYKTYVARLGLTSFTPAATTQNGNVWTLTRDANYELVSTLTGYTSDNRPVSTLDRSGVSKAIIWGYGHTLPIATVTNGTAATGTTGDGLLATAAHTSFEEDGVNGVDGDGWSIPTFCLTEAKTGNRSARIVVNQSQYGPGKVITLEAGANRHGKMVYSCWVKVPNSISNSVYLHLVVAGVGSNSSWQDAVYQVNPNQDWQYVEKVFDLDAPAMNSGLSSTDRLSIVMYPWCPSGSELLIDEVRVHRLDASMQTTTYNPLVGKTSITDPSGVTTYYTYDSNNYLRLVLNQKHDIVQRTQQHLPGQAARPNADFNVPDVVAQGCPAKLVAVYSTCTNASDITYTWDFGDGSTVVNGDAVQNHLYPAQGTYTVSLLVTDPVKGASRFTKTVTVNDVFYTELSPGDLDFNLCDNPTASVTLTAFVPAATCQTVTYQWQVASGGSWVNLAGTTQSITQRVTAGTRQYRCVITIAGLGNNSASPTIPVVNITGYYPSNVRDCNSQGPTPAAQAVRK